MGRTLKRVPMDFNWPKRIIWKGFLNPYKYIECEYCQESGYSQEFLQAIREEYNIAKGQKINFYDISSDYNRNSEKHKKFKKIKQNFEENSIEMDCPLCEGSGEYFASEEVKELYNKWGPIEPPEGEGYQLWETTSEGSPLSPVFKTLDEVCEWAAENATVFADIKATKEKWREMLDGGMVGATMHGANPETGQRITFFMC